jgi:asparagine synthase (glutamine-hydrolysing)
MCGFVSFHTSSVDLEKYENELHDMLETVKHRGPDGQGFKKIYKQLMQGHVRLAIFDHKHGQQPMESNDGRYSLVFNGAIYNYIEIRKELLSLGITLHTQTDTEVLLQGLIVFGKEITQKLVGMFTFVFHDSKDNSWIAARDQFGIKPMYYLVSSDLVLFASEKKSIEKLSLSSFDVDFDALTDFLILQFTFEEKTLTQQIKKVEPGSVLCGVGSEIVLKEKYWNPEFNESDLDKDAALELLEFQLSESVNLNMRGDFEVGSYLSGGLDSSLIASLAQKNQNQRMKVFHGKFIDNPFFDESNFAELVANSNNFELFQVVITKEQFLEEIKRLIRILDEPIAGIGSFPQLMVSRYAATQVKVILGGHGGDELFGGYTRYFLAYLEQSLKGAINENQEEGTHLVVFSDLLSQLPTLKNYTPLMKSFWSNGLFDSMDQRYFKLLDRSSELIGLLNPEVAQSINPARTFEKFRDSFNATNSPSYINKMLNFDLINILPSLLHVEDRVSMAHSLESRVPFLDPRLIETLSSLSPAMKFAKGESKFLLKRIASAYIPSQIVERRDKMGFPVPLELWMKDAKFRNTIKNHILSAPNLWNSNILSNSTRIEDLQPRVLWGMLSLSIWWSDVFKK